MSEIRNIVALGIIGWDFRYQRPQHLLSGLNRLGYNVLYVNESACPEWGNTLHNRGPGLYTCQASGQGYIKDLLLNETDCEEAARAIRHFIDQLNFDHFILWVDSPYWEPIVARLRPDILLYNCMDDYAFFPDLAFRAENLKSQEKRLLQKAHLTISSSYKLYIEKSKIAKRIELVQNAVDFPHFYRAATQELSYPDDLPRNAPVVGYYGAIADWFDLNAIIAIARLPYYLNIVLIGAVSINVNPVRHLQKVHFLGEKPYESLPNYLRHFQIALIPFIKNNLTYATNPVKMYEYLAAGKPVVATDLPEIRRFRDVIGLCSTPKDFGKKIGSALSSKNFDFSERAKRISKVRHETWEARCERIHQLINEIP